MANSIGAYQEDALNDIGAYEAAAAAGGGGTINTKTLQDLISIALLDGSPIQ